MMTQFTDGSFSTLAQVWKASDKYVFSQICEIWLRASDFCTYSFS